MAQPKVKVRFEVEGEGEAKAALQRTSKEAETAADRIDRRMSSLGNTLKALGIGTLIGAGLGFMIEKAMESERAIGQLDAVLKSTGGAAGVSRQQILGLADALADQTTYSKSAIVEMESMLLTFTALRGPIVQGATQAILDISARMGTDLKSAAVQVGKALNDPIKGVSALAEVGVSFTKQQQDVIKALVDTGDVAAAQRVILEELANEFGGAAAAARDTFGGAIEGLKNQLAETVSGGSGSLDGAKTAVEELTKVMGSPETQAGFDVVLTGLASLVTWAAEAIAAVGGLSGAIADSFKDSSSIGYDALLARYHELNEELTEMDKRGASSKGLFGLGTTRKEVADELARVSDLLEARRKIAETEKTNFGQDTFPLDGERVIHAEEYGGFGKKGADRSAATAAARAAREAARAQREQQQAAADYLSTMKDLEAEVGGPLAEAMREYEVRLEKLNELAAKGKVSDEEQRRAKAALLDLRDKEIAKIKEQLDPAGKLIEDMQFELSLLGMTNAERRTAIDLRNLEVDATDAQADRIRALNEALERQSEITGEVDNFRQSVQGLFEDIIKGGEDGANAWKRFGDAIVAQIARIIAEQATAQLFGQQGQSGGGLFGSLINGLFGFMSGGAGGWGATGANSGGWGGSLPTLGDFGEFAKGTSFAPGGLALVGERGPELVNLPRGSQVIPNDRLGGHTTINVNLPQVTEYKTGEQIANATSRALSRANARK